MCVQVANTTLLCQVNYQVHLQVHQVQRGAPHDDGGGGDEGGREAGNSQRDSCRAMSNPQVIIGFKERQGKTSFSEKYANMRADLGLRCKHIHIYKIYKNSIFTTYISFCSIIIIKKKAWES